MPPPCPWCGAWAPWDDLAGHGPRCLFPLVYLAAMIRANRTPLQ